MPSKNQLYVRRGAQDFGVTDDSATDIHNKLPLGVYRVSFIQFVGWVFEKIDDFVLPEKLYGNLTKQATRVYKTYRDRLAIDGRSTGVLLSGSKGAGKTLLAKKVAMDSGLPVIVVNAPYSNDSFKELIAGLGECVILFDEFEKVYRDPEDQNAMLTLFDGVFAVKALMFLIVNESNRLVDPLLNRPGRIFYALDYRGLEREFIEDYCKDRLNNQDNIMGVLSVATMFEHFNFDMLQALVEEMNRFEETATEAVKYLNINSGYFNSFKRYSVKAFEIASGKSIKLDKSMQVLMGHPLSSKHAFRYWRYFNEEDDREDVSIAFQLSEGNLSKIDPVSDTYTFEENGIRVILSKQEYGGGFEMGHTERANRDGWLSDRTIMNIEYDSFDD